MLRAALALVVVLLCSCGGPTAELTGSSHAELPDRPIQLELRTVDGHVVDLADQRGGLVLLFVLATYDGLSQAAVRPVTRFTRAAEDTVVLGVIVEPSASDFAAAYETTFRPPYTVVYDDSGRIALGTSDLGELPGVPTFYMIDAHGRVVDRRTGYLSEHELFALRDRALARGGVVTRPTPPTVSEPDAPPEGEPATGESESEPTTGESEPTTSDSAPATGESESAP